MRRARSVSSPPTRWLRATLARLVGLGAMVADGFAITKAIQSRSWPAASANPEYAAVWGRPGPISDDAPCIADDSEVPIVISTLLEAQG
jgi:hypothetical protein